MMPAAAREGLAMMLMIEWRERPQGSALEYEAAQRRILDVFRHWEFPATVKVVQFLARVGEWGGFMLLDTEDIHTVQKLVTIFPAFSFRVKPVMQIGDAVNAELEGMGWRDSVAA
jgi:muconolactone delta-isomerase